MTRGEVAAFNAGVRVVLALAGRIAARLAIGPRRPPHHAFAVEALQALAEEAEALILPEPPPDATAPPRR